MFQKKIVNTVICYNNPDEVVSYAQKFSELEDSNNACLIITINLLEEGKYIEFENRIKEVKLECIICKPDRNLGYMNGMLFGYECYKSKTNNHTPEYLIMSNTDIDYPDSKLLKKLLEQEYDDDVWVIGPAVFVPKRRSYDNPIADHRRSVSEINLLIKKFGTPIINELYIIASLLKGRLVRKDIGNSRKVYEVHGCYFIVKGCMSDVLLESPFGAILYSEETYVAETAFRHNKIEYYDTSLVINHIEHTVTSKIKAKKIAKYLYDSMKIIKRDYY